MATEGHTEQTAAVAKGSARRLCVDDLDEFRSWGPDDAGLRRREFLATMRRLGYLPLETTR